MKPEGYARIVVSDKGKVWVRDVWNMSRPLEIEWEELENQLEGLLPDEAQNTETLVVFGYECVQEGGAPWEPNEYEDVFHLLHHTILRKDIKDTLRKEFDDEIKITPPENVIIFEEGSVEIKDHHSELAQDLERWEMLFDIEYRYIKKQEENIVDFFEVR